MRRSSMGPRCAGSDARWRQARALQSSGSQCRVSRTVQTALLSSALVATALVRDHWGISWNEVATFYIVLTSQIRMSGGSMVGTKRPPKVTRVWGGIECYVRLYFHRLRTYSVSVPTEHPGPKHDNVDPDPIYFRRASMSQPWYSLLQASR